MLHALAPESPASFWQDPVDPEVIRGDTAICQGDTAQIELEVGDNPLQWIGGNTASLSCTDCPNPRAFPTQSTTYRAVVDAGFFIDTIDVRVQVYRIRVGADRALCQGDEIRIRAGEDFVGATYEWTVAPETGLTIDDSTAAAPVFSGEQVGVYQVGVSLNAPGCSQQVSLEVTVQDGLAAGFNISDDREICESGEVELGGAPVAGTTYSWTTEGGTPLPGGINDLANPSVTVSETTTFFLEVFNGLCPLPVTDSVVVAVAEDPELEVINDTTVCQNDTLQLGLTNPAADVEYAWTGPGEILFPDNPRSPIVITEPGSYVLTATRGECTVTRSVNITTLYSVDVEGEDTLRLCLGDELTLRANVSPADSTPLWTSNLTGFTPQRIDSITVAPTDSAKYFATIGDEQCRTTDSVLVVVDSLPQDLSIMPADTTICEGDFVKLITPTFEPSDFPEIEFSWQPFEGQQTPDSLLNLVATPTDTTTYARVNTSGACVDTSTAVVNVNPITPIQIVPADTTVCPGEQVDLSIDIMGEGELEMIMWMPMQGLSCTDCPDPTALVTQSTAVSVQGMINDCPTSASASLNVFPAPPLNLAAETIICQGDSLLLNSASAPGVTYTWSSTDPLFDQFNNPTPTVAPTQTATYTVVADDGQCEPVTAEITVEVVQTATVEASASANNLCPGDEVTVTATATGASAAETFSWTTSDGRSFSGPEFTDQPTETTIYFLTYTSGGGCQTESRTVTVEVEPPITLSLTADPPVGSMVAQGSPVTLMADIDNPGDLDIEIRWTQGGAPLEGAAGATEITVNPVDTASYLLTVTTPNGCTYTARASFNVEPAQFVIPNAFTPNGDGVNEFFNIVQEGMVDEIVRFQVFNRWGEVVYDNENPGMGWDGTFNGDPQPSDVYAYIITVRFLDGEEQTEQGDVTLLR